LLQYGADVTFTEMCIAEYHLQRFKKKVKQYTFEFDVADRPLIAQLGGNVAAPIIELANSELFVDDHQPLSSCTDKACLDSKGTSTGST
jgi:hypothetical protein